MKQELQERLFEKYPKIFCQKDLPMQVTCMCWGITCGDGWFNIIDALCGQIQHHIKYNIHRGEGTIVAEATQVKEKYGSLRFYYEGGDEYIGGLVRMAEAMSSVTCESCGNPGTSNKRGWIHTLCSCCKSKRFKEKKEEEKESDWNCTSTGEQK